MATHSVPGLYRRYKTGTHHVVTWLSNATLQQSNISTIVPCLRHLADTKAKRNKPGKQKFESASPEVPEVTRLTTRNLLELPSVLATAADRKQLPPKGITDTVLILEDVIAGRKECSRWYARKSRTEHNAIQESDVGHDAFIRILLQVLADLKAAIQKSRQNRQSAVASSPTQSQQLANIYHALYVDNPEDPTNQTHSKSTKTSTNTTALFRLDESREKEQAFALWCLLAECYKIRQYVKEVWTEQQAGNVTAKIASQVSTYAVLLSANLTNDFSKDFPNLATFDKIADHLHLTASLSGIQVEQFSCDDGRSVADDGLSAASISELVCLQAVNGLSIIRRYQDALANDDSVYAKSTLSLCAHQCFYMIGFYLPELLALKNEKGRLSALGYGDAFTQLLLDFVSYKKSPMDLLSVIAFQMQLAVHDIVGINDGCEYVKFEMDVDQVQSSAEKYQSFVDNLPHANQLDQSFKSAPTRK